ncbi:hypothetical protein IMSHALPRED_011022 [Imshaugia aleurites]|uniref:Uncharacterized protein n=1 Tax=Imshaugia aleurites TaxID=172621 RepID=A0A8H3G5U2_9LECA|nr:hypothetical protein IMSHALPRED_011022 [Imshaugia aleurites]
MPCLQRSLGRTSSSYVTVVEMTVVEMTVVEMSVVCLFEVFKSGDDSRGAHLFAANGPSSRQYLAW